MYKVLFVCTGNICRSPTADAIFRDMVDKAGLSERIVVDSSGMGSWHVGNPPDERATSAARRRGYEMSFLRARQTRAADFQEFDMIIAMDRGHLRELSALCPEREKERLRLFMDFAPSYSAQDVPDPYYGGAQGFETVLDMIEEGCGELLQHIRKEGLA